MSTRRLEEILEECLSAYLDGRRSIEESLSRYPSYASELEPILRTATSINRTLRSYSPPAHLQERGLHRFLSDARARRNLKALQQVSVQPSRFAITWQKYRLGFAGAAMSLAILAAAVGGAAILDEDSSQESVFPVETNEPATPVVVTNLRQQVDTVRSLRASESLTPDDIVRLRMATEALASAPDGDIDSAKATVAVALNDANALVSEIIATQGPELAQPAQDAQARIRQVAADNNIPLTATPTTVDTATPGVTPAPTTTPTEAPTPTPEPTVAPTEPPAPTPSPASSETPPPRDPA